MPDMPPPRTTENTAMIIGYRIRATKPDGDVYYLYASLDDDALWPASRRADVEVAADACNKEFGYKATYEAEAVIDLERKHTGGDSMKKQYFVRFRARLGDVPLHASQMIETDDVRTVRDTAWSAARSWGRANNVDTVEFDIEWPADFTETARIGVALQETTRPTATLELDNRHKFYAVLEALRAYVESNADFRHNTDCAHMADGEAREFDARHAAAVEIVDTLEDVLAELAEA